MSTTTSLDTLKINYLTQAQYDTALANNEINENEIYMTPYKEPIVDLIYPVGSIYMSVNNVSPATFLEGTTWEQIEDRFLLAAGSTYAAGETGGAAATSLAEANLPSHNHSYTKPPTATGSHTLTVSEIPSHTHSTGNSTWTSFALTKSTGDITRGSVASGSGTSNVVRSDSALNNDATATGSTGSGGGHTHPITNSSTTTGNTGSGTAFSNMPPYLTVYMWKRTA